MITTYYKNNEGNYSCPLNIDKQTFALLEKTLREKFPSYIVTQEYKMLGSDFNFTDPEDDVFFMLWASDGIEI